MDEIKPRYEFKVWADILASVYENLGLAQPKARQVAVRTQSTPA